MIISEIQSEIGHCSYDSAKFKAPADFSHHAILCMTLSLMISFSLAEFFFKLIFFEQKSARNTIKVSNAFFSCD